MKIWIYSGRPSTGAAQLAKAGLKRMHKGKFVKMDDVVVNWGSGHELPAGYLVLNPPESVLKAVNKLITFQVLAGKKISTVPWTANMAVAKEWKDAGSTIIARKTLTGSEGAGIIVVEKGDELIEAPLYTKYIFKVKEFRVHATQSEVIDTQQKVRDPTKDPQSWKIRSYNNGFIFQRNNIEPNEKRDALAIQTLKALGLDFGGLDIIEDKKGNFYVLEVNTAPGIEGSSIGKYKDALTKLAIAKAG